MGTKKIVEPWIRTGIGLVLWAISSVLTAELFLGFAGKDIVKQGVMLGFAIGLEGAKILSWRMGGSYRILAVSLITLSAMASLGAALETVEGIRNQAGIAEGNQPLNINQAETEIHDIDRQITILVDRLAIIPADFTSVARQLNIDLEQLRNRRSLSLAIFEKQNAVQKGKPRHQTMFDLIAQALRVPAETVMLVILLFMATNLEIAALVLAGHRIQPIALSLEVNGPVGQSAQSIGQYPIRRLQPKVSTEQFLEAAKTGAELPFLNGRDTTAKTLGIRSYEAKVHVKNLIKTGQVKVCGKRLVLID